MSANKDVVQRYLERYQCLRCGHIASHGTFCHCRNDPGNITTNIIPRTAVPNPKISAYINSSLVWGSEPVLVRLPCSLLVPFILAFLLRG